MKIQLPIKPGITLKISSKGSTVFIYCSFKPSEYPDFTNYLDSNFELREVYNGEGSTPYYRLFVENLKANNFLQQITEAAEVLIETDNPLPVVHVGTKTLQHVKA